MLLFLLREASPRKFPLECLYAELLLRGRLLLEELRRAEGHALAALAQLCSREDGSGAEFKQTVVITGASRGIGLEFARQLLQAGGYRVVATCRRPGFISY